MYVIVKALDSMVYYQTKQGDSIQYCTAGIVKQKRTAITTKPRNNSGKRERERNKVSLCSSQFCSFQSPRLSDPNWFGLW